MFLSWDFFCTRRVRGKAGFYLDFLGVVFVFALLNFPWGDCQSVENQRFSFKKNIFFIFLKSCFMKGLEFFFF